MNSISLRKILTGQRIGVVAALVLLCVLLGVASPFFLTAPNLLNIGSAIAIVGIVACGATLVMLSGGIDISIGSTVALTGVVAAQVLNVSGNWILGVLAGLICGAIAGVFNGVLVTVFHINPLIATLGTLSAFRGLAYVASGGVAVSASSPEFLAIGTGRILGVPSTLIIMIVIFILVGILLNSTIFGRNVYAIGGNPDAAKLAGISLTKYRIALYGASGLLAGIAGVVLAARLGSAQPAAGAGLELDAIAATVLGGVALAGGIGTIAGTVLGVLVLGIVNNGLNILQVESFYQYIARGAVLIIAVALDQVSVRRRSTGRASSNPVDPVPATNPVDPVPATNPDDSAGFGRKATS